MNEQKIQEHLKKIEAHSFAMLDIASSEQHLGLIQVATHAALMEILQCLKAIVLHQTARGLEKP